MININNIANVFGYNNTKVYQQEELVEKSVFGLPIFMSVILEKDGVYRFDDAQKNKIAPGYSVYLPCCIVEISQTKNIVKTDIAGGRGTVKELMSDGDFLINIKGVINNDKYYANGQAPQAVYSNDFPETRLKELDTYFKAQTVIPITNRLLNALGVYAIVIESYKYPAMPGFENLIAFDFNALSDQPIELKLKTEE